MTLTAPIRYLWRHLLWAFPRRLVRVWFEAKLVPAECVRLVNEAYAAGMSPRRRLHAGMPWWRPPLRVIGGTEVWRMAANGSEPPRRNICRTSAPRGEAD
jgi:hypothetical protein